MRTLATIQVASLALSACFSKPVHSDGKESSPSASMQLVQDPPPSGEALPTHTLGGTVSGLAAGRTLVLQNNSSETLTVARNGYFSFAAPLVQGSPYTVTVLRQPEQHHCTVNQGHGAARADLPPVVITCLDRLTRQAGLGGFGAFGRAIASDALGHYYVVGNTTGALDGSSITGSFDVFLSKYDQQNVRLWTRLLGSPGQASYGTSVTTDAQGNAYVSGYTQGGLDGNSSTGTFDAFLSKFDSSGARIWTRQMGVVAQPSYALRAAADSSGHILVTGYTLGGLDGNSLKGASDLFLSKFDGQGTRLWTQQLGAAGAQTQGMAVATDSADNIYVTGYTTGSLDVQPSIGSFDMLLIKFDAAGARQWTRQLGAQGSMSFGYALAIDPNGSPVVAGYTTGALEGNVLTGTNDFFVTKYDSSGQRLWISQMGVVANDTRSNAVTVDASGHIYVAGYTYGNLDGNTLTGMSDFFISKFNGNGQRQWTRQMGVTGPYDTWAFGITSNPAGHILVTGSTEGGLDGNSLADYSDYFVTRFWP